MLVEIDVQSFPSVSASAVKYEATGKWFFIHPQLLYDVVFPR
jgi:hypothetical protein